MAHYYSASQDSKLKKYTVKLRVHGQEYELTSASGIFSSRTIDKGTQLLIEHCIVQPGWHVLDLGCGYGAVGMAFAKSHRLGRLVMSDINGRAVMVAKENARTLGVDAEVVRSDGYANITGEFDTIVLNPPQSAGKDICFAMIEGALQHLRVGGLLQLVCRHNKGGRMLSEKMKSVFGNVNDIAKKAGYRVYVSQKL